MRKSVCWKQSIASLFIIFISGFVTVNVFSQTIVSSCNLNGWVIQTSGTSSLTFVNGPAAPPMPTGSARFAVGTDGDGAAQLRTGLYNGTALSALTELSYWAFVQQDGSGGQDVYMMLNVDYNGDGDVDDFLFFEPVYQTATFFPSNPQPAIVLNTWQKWDALHGLQAA